MLSSVHLWLSLDPRTGQGLAWLGMMIWGMGVWGKGGETEVGMRDLVDEEMKEKYEENAQRPKDQGLEPHHESQYGGYWWRSSTQFL